MEMLHGHDSPPACRLESARSRQVLGKGSGSASSLLMAAQRFSLVRLHLPYNPML